MQFYCLFGIRNDTKKEMNERKKIKKKSEIHQLRKRKRWVQCEQVKGMNRCHLFLFIFLLLMLLMRLTVCGKATNSLHIFFFTVPLHCHGPIVLSSVLVDICLSAIAQQPCWCVFSHSQHSNNESHLLHTYVYIWLNTEYYAPMSPCDKWHLTRRKVRVTHYLKWSSPGTTSNNRIFFDYIEMRPMRIQAHTQTHNKRQLTRGIE